jgi:hypothetical protein
MVNIKYYINGFQVLENEYQSTAYSNFNDIISKLKNKVVYKVFFRRVYSKDQSLEKTIYAIVVNNRFELYDTNAYQINDQYYGPLVHNSSRWKVFFNETPYKLIKITNNITYDTDDKNSKPIVKFNRIMDKGDFDMEKFYPISKNYVIEIDSIILNYKNVDPPKYEDLETYNEMVINITVIKKIEPKSMIQTDVKSNYNDYCSIC